jgi:hypothetical protein
MVNKFWLLYARDEYGTDNRESPWFNNWDCAHGFVVEAETEDEARRLASGGSGDEGAHAWLQSKYSHCIELLPSDKPGVILRDFNAG